MKDKSKDDYISIDEAFEDEEQYEVYYDGPARRPYNADLRKVNLKNGLNGDYVFYKLQLIRDTNRELYIVLTRWGRIGEEGMHQRTPFTQVEDAKKEFEKIFRQKSGNEWATAETNFEKKDKKYNLSNEDYSNVHFGDKL